MTGFVDHFKDQIEGLRAAHECALSRIPGDAWTFGGGTALAIFHLAHRRSYDIDIFIQDPQYFAFLSPKWYIDDGSAFKTEYVEMAHHISLTTARAVKVDFLLAPRLTDDHPIPKRIGGVDALVETVPEIIAKKLRYRMKDLRPRDIFDAAAAIRRDAGILKELLDKRAITLDELYEWKTMLSELDGNRYRDAIRIVRPERGFRSLALDAPAIVIQGIDRAKTEVARNL